jgi:HD-GYP domain-containing protein (c-di-GMP phosphodiesterase class II)
MPQLKVTTGTEPGKVYDLNKDSLKIGRDPTCDILVSDHGVSREHAEVYRVGQMFFIRDLESRNGVLVNDAQVEDELLRDGDMIRLCNHVFHFESTAQTAEGHTDHFDNTDPGETIVMNFDELDEAPSASNRFRQHTQKLTETIKDAHKMEELLELVMDLIMKQVKVEEIFIFLLEPGHRLAQKGYRHAKGKRKGKASRSIVLRALKENRPIITANAMDDFRFKAESSIAINQVGSVLCCPMSSCGREIGVLYLNNKPESGPFAPDAADWVQSLSAQLAPILEVHQLRQSEAQVTNQSVKLLCHTVEGMVPQLAGRGDRVAAMSNALAKAVGLKRSQLLTLHLASYLHHIGFMEIYMKRQEPFTFEELNTNLDYVKASVQFLEGNDCYADAMSAVASHRYKLNGDGTPSTLNIVQWSVESQILSLCVELDSRLHLPLSFGRSPDSTGEVVENLISNGTEFVTRPIVNLLKQAWKKRLILQG